MGSGGPSAVLGITALVLIGGGVAGGYVTLAVATGVTADSRSVTKAPILSGTSPQRREEIFPGSGRVLALDYPMSAGQRISTTFGIPHMKNVAFGNSKDRYLSGTLDFPISAECPSGSVVNWRISGVTNQKYVGGQFRPGASTDLYKVWLGHESFGLSAWLESSAPCAGTLRFDGSIDNNDPPHMPVGK